MHAGMETEKGFRRAVEQFNGAYLQGNVISVSKDKDNEAWKNQP